MDRLAKINRILDSCLTTETLDRIYPFEKKIEETLLTEDEVRDRHRLVQIDLLELVNSSLTRELLEKVDGDGFRVIYNRIGQFLFKHNIKTSMSHE